MLKERRKFKRFDTFVSVKCQRKNKEVVLPVVSLSKDLSRNGMCINTNEAIDEGSILNMEIELPDDPRPVRSEGRVMWSRGSSADEGVDYGIQFVSIDPVDKFRVLDYAYNHWLETRVNDYADLEDPLELS